jgi:hypothetical protein
MEKMDDEVQTNKKRRDVVRGHEKDERRGIKTKKSNA